MEDGPTVAVWLASGMTAETFRLDFALHSGDFLIRGVFGADTSTGAIEIADVVKVGAAVQFQVHDAVGADKDLHLTVEPAATELPGRPAGALLFTCNGRGRQMFGVADHDAATNRKPTGRDSARRLLCRRRDRPGRGRNALHAFTALMALFVE